MPRYGVLLIPIFALLSLPLPLQAGDACGDCHEKRDIGAGDRSVHVPFQEDDCGACHLDHGDQERLVLTASGNALCSGCHDSGEGSFLRAHGGVRGERASCLSCHDPHRSSQQSLLLPNRHRPLAFGRCDPCHRYDGRLLKPLRELCLGCHGGEEFSRRITHAPVGRGECLACHDPHASREPFLLLGRFSEGIRVAGEADVALCLRCHARDAFFPDSPDRTLFRGGGRNYHALHLAPASAGGRPAEAGRIISCRACHEAHTSDWPRLVRRELDCGGVPCLKLDFRRTDSGGECRSGCHAPKSYAFAERAAPPPPVPPAAPSRDRATLPKQTPLEESINRRCVSCHESAVRSFARAHVHAPVREGLCSSCHLDHGPENRLILLGREERLCARCHDLRARRSVTAHAGYSLEGSRCTECHDPHSAANAALLHQHAHPPFEDRDCGACHGKPAAGWRIGGDLAELCGSCHEDVSRGTHRHTALGAKGCTGCHRPHASRERALLRAAIPALCFRCHAKVPFVQETIHDPVREGDCGACHPPHASPNRGLLARAYPLEQFVAFAAERYALCWECHDEGALTDAGRAGDTGFSDGARNLHALHLRDRSVTTELGTRVQPGIACRNCHDPHATERPRLIRRSLDCGGVPCLQLDFRKAGAGGRCLGGCHVSQPYLPAGR